MNNLFDQSSTSTTGIFLKSPMNYTGSKYPLLPQLFKYFPPDREILVDLFCGGGSVFVNDPVAKKVIVNDVISPLIEFYSILNLSKWEDLISDIKSRMSGMDFKNCQQDYLALRQRYNDDKDCLDFFLLCCCCTNNMMRFNADGGFNQTWGRRTFNESMLQKLYLFWGKMHEQTHRYTFISMDFENVSVFPGDFVYLDPPYAITGAGYNTTWNAERETRLHAFLDKLDHRGVRFAMSNVSMHKGVNNPHMDKLSKYNVINLKNDYAKVSRSDNLQTQEILVTNYVID